MVDPVWEEIVEQIDNVVMAAVECDTGNLATIIKLHDKLMEIAELVMETPHYALGIIAQRSAELSMTIVLQEAEDPENLLNTVIEATSTLQCMAREILNGRSPEYIPVPEGLGLKTGDMFKEMEKKPEMPHAVAHSHLEYEPAKERVDEKPKAPEIGKEWPSRETPEAHAPTPAPAKIVEKPKEEAAKPKAVPQKEIEPVREGNFPVFDMHSLTPSHLADFLSEVNELLSRAEGLLLGLEKSPHHASEDIQDLLGVFHTIKGVAGIIKLQEVSSLAHDAEVLLEETTSLPRQAIDVLFEVIDTFKAFSRSLHHYHEKQGLLEVPDIVPLLEKLKTIDLTQDIPLDTGTKEIDKQAITAELEEIKDRYLKEQLPTEELKIRTDRLDGLIDAIGELVIAQSMVENDSEIPKIARAETMRNIITMSKICRQLQELAMSMRMVTIQSTFQTMERMVRDIASKQNKPVEVLVEGEYTEVDRNVIEALYNPLVHMVRNAIDHGIESAEERLKMGKPKKGRISFQAYQRSGNIVISIEDDGKGLDRSRIYEKAIAQELLKPDHAYTEEEIFQVVFLPGFSTASEVTEISGRGVGLDVVKKTIEKFRGHVEVSSKKGQGTAFRISLPLTLAIIDGMLVRLGDETYIIPLVNIEEFVQVPEEQVSTITNRGEILKLRGDVVPIFRLDRLLKRKAMGEKDTRVGVIISWEGKKCCLIVNELIGQQQVVIKSLGSDFCKLVGISGATILGDGRVGLILDIQNILNVALGAGLTA